MLPILSWPPIDCDQSTTAVGKVSCHVMQQSISFLVFSVFFTASTATTSTAFSGNVQIKPHTHTHTHLCSFKVDDPVLSLGLKDAFNNDHMHISSSQCISFHKCLSCSGSQWDVGMYCLRCRVHHMCTISAVKHSVQG